MQVKEIRDALFESRMETVARLGSMGISKNTLALRGCGKEWGHRWRQPPVCEQQKRQPQQRHGNSPLSLPDVLLTFMADMGITNASESFFFFGGLTPSTEQWDGCHSGRLQLSSSSVSTSPSPPLNVLTSLCINAIDDIKEETSLRPAVVAPALRLLLKRMGYDEKEEEENAEDTENGGATGGRGLSSLLTLRFFVLSPHAPYAALYEAANKKTGTTTLPVGGEACDVLLVYVFPKTTVGVLGTSVAHGNPEVWGRARRRQEEDGTCAGQHDELFFIASNVGDYLRLGSAFSWVYGWQLCYASQGPPPRSLPWLKLLSPGALSAALASPL